MKNRIGVWLLLFGLGVISGVVLQHQTRGASDRAQIATLQAELQARSEKLDKCTDALIHTSNPGATPATR